MAEADERILLWITDLAGTSSLLDNFMRVVVNDYFIPICLSLVLLALWFWGRDQEIREENQRSVLRAAVTLGTVSLAIMISNALHDRARPFMDFPELLASNVEEIFYAPTDPSFPSNMAAVVFGIAAAVCIHNHKLGALLLIPAFLVCFARVFAGVHYPSDILAGAIIGILSALLAHYLILPLLEPLVKGGFKLARKLCLA